jgi:S-methylmethionine-dependent homocysteine/selenocysteine methylase
MARYRDALPQLRGDLFLTDGGMETTLVFDERLELPCFAAFPLLDVPEGEATLRRYFRTYAALATRFGTGLVLDTATWRASTDWGARLGYDRDALANANRKAVRLLEDVRAEYEAERTPLVIEGCLGPRGDGYVAGRTMSVAEAEAYHHEQVATFSVTAADMVCAMTMNYVEEAVGIARAARTVNMPVTISFTVETDGRLLTGQTLQAAIEHVDEATAGYPCYYMINCAHPTHFERVLDPRERWVERIRGLRANASRRSHAELDAAPELDTGDPEELGRQYAELRARLGHLNVLGGCCGTDHRHIERIATATLPLFRMEVG